MKALEEGGGRVNINLCTHTYHNCENQDEMVLSLSPSLVPRTYANQN